MTSIKIMLFIIMLLLMPFWAIIGAFVFGLAGLAFVVHYFPIILMVLIAIMFFSLINSLFNHQERKNN